jgi:hypothetical protein
MSTNYVKFGPQEMVVQFATDKGELKTNENGDYFFRGFADGRRFSCINPELERRLIDLNYRAGEQVAIARQTRNRTVIWKVRLIEPDAAPPPVQKRTPPPLPAAMPPRSREAERPVRSVPQSIPPAKYAAPPVAWPETEVNGNGHAASNGNALRKPNGTAAPTAPTHGDQTKQQLKEYLFDAVDIVIDAQAYAAKLGLLFTPAFAEIQDIATSLFIQRSKQSNIDQMDRNNRARANGGADPWRH